MDGGIYSLQRRGQKCIGRKEGRDDSTRSNLHFFPPCPCPFPPCLQYEDGTWNRDKSRQKRPKIGRHPCEIYGRSLDLGFDINAPLPAYLSLCLYTELCTQYSPSAPTPSSTMMMIFLLNSTALTHSLLHSSLSRLHSSVFCLGHRRMEGGRKGDVRRE